MKKEEYIEKIRNFLNGTLPPEESKELQELLQDDDEFQQLFRMEEQLFLAGRIQQEHDRKLKQSLEALPDASPSPLRAVAGWAATLAIALVLAFVIYHYCFQPPVATVPQSIVTVPQPVDSVPTDNTSDTPPPVVSVPQPIVSVPTDNTIASPEQQRQFILVHSQAVALIKENQTLCKVLSQKDSLYKICVLGGSPRNTLYLTLKQQLIEETETLSEIKATTFTPKNDKESIKKVTALLDAARQRNTRLLSVAESLNTRWKTAACDSILQGKAH